MDKSFFDFDENLINITECEVLGKLPNPFLFDNGKKVETPEDWAERRKEIYKSAVELQYGIQPPKPEVFNCEILYGNAPHSNNISVRIVCGTKEKQVSFILRIFKPKADNPPVVVDGDMCFPYVFDEGYLDEFLSRGIAYATFNRVEVANDIQHEGRRIGPLYEVYPEYSFGALGAWAWAYSRCVDALECIGGFNLDYLAFTGHSRGGKTCMLAGVLDERAKIVNPNETNAGSCSCYRIHTKGIMENGETFRSETLHDLWNNYGYWLGEGMEAYKDCEEKLPFDCHFLKSMVAPRVLLIGEAASDLWTNVVGTWQTSLAAKEVFKFLGCEENLKWYFRKGYHYHHKTDASMLANLIMSLMGREELYPYYYKIPFKPIDNIFDWKA